MIDIPSHHRVYGTCTDFITGKEIVDTDDERIRQELARLLVEEKGYGKNELVPRRTIETLFAGQFVVSTIEIAVRLEGKFCMILRYGPGSIVTRERPAIAAARVLEQEYQIPLVVVTNGRDAELVDTYSGKVLKQGLAEIPGRNELIGMIGSLLFKPLPEKQREKELRILNAYDIQICCVGGPCALPDAKEG
jgi:hypothetical protein